MILHDGPRPPRFPLALIHPLGPLFRHLPLSLRRHLLFLRAFGRWGNFRRPTTYREKAQWRTINDRRERLCFGQDKLAAKEYARECAAKVGVPLRIPVTYWVGTDLRELRALQDQLPERWVLKPNHSAGRSLIVERQLTDPEWDHLMSTCSRWVERDEEELVMGHWAYGEARHLLIAEERVGTGSHAPNDVKVTSLNGTPNYFFWADRSSGSLSLAFFHMDGTQFHWGDEGEVDANSLVTNLIPGPELRTQMSRIAEAMAEPFDWLRVDFYWEEGQLWFGELTLYGAGGLYKIDRENNERLGALWQLPDLNAPDPRESEWRTLLHGTPKGTLQR